jgi:hypothetical protein
VENLEALPARITLIGGMLRDELKHVKEFENILDMRVAIDKAIERVETMLDNARMAAEEVDERAHQTLRPRAPSRRVPVTLLT